MNLLSWLERLSLVVFMFKQLGTGIVTQPVETREQVQPSISAATSHCRQCAALCLKKHFLFPLWGIIAT